MGSWSFFANESFEYTVFCLVILWQKELKKVTFYRDGKKVRTSAYGHTISEINEKIAKILNNSENANKKSFQSVSEEWEEHHFKNIAYGTQVCYTPALRRAREAFDGMTIDEIKPLDIKRLLEGLDIQKFSAKTVKNAKGRYWIDL